MDEQTFINLYINNLNKEIEELTKQRMMLITKEQFALGTIETLKQKVEELEVQVEDNERLYKENEKLQDDNLKMRNVTKELDVTKKNLDQTKNLLQQRDKDFESSKHEIVKLRDELTNVVTGTTKDDLPPTVMKRTKKK